MDASYYVPKMPMSVPMYDPSKKTFSVFYSDGMMADIPADLFYKMFYLKGDETEFDATYGVAAEEAKPSPEEKVSSERKPDESINEFISRNFSRKEIEEEANKTYDELLHVVKVAKFIGMTYEQFIGSAFEKSNMNDLTRDQIISLTKSIWDKA